MTDDIAARLRDYRLTLNPHEVICDRRVVDEAEARIRELETAVDAASKLMYKAHEDHCAAERRLSTIEAETIERCAKVAGGQSAEFDHQAALAECRDCESGFHRGRIAAATAIRQLAQVKHEAE